MTEDEVLKIIEAYDALIDRAMVATAPGYDFYISVQKDDIPRLRVDSGNAVLVWKEYESGYYGDGYYVEKEGQFPVELLCMDEEAFRARQEKVGAEIKEREAKVAAARAAVQRDLKEKHDRAEFARLKAKYEKS